MYNRDGRKRRRSYTYHTFDNNHTAYKHICLQEIGCVCVKNYPPEIMQPSSSTRATIVSAEDQNGATIVKVRPHFSFAIITSYGNQITPAKTTFWNASGTFRLAAK